MEQLWNDEQTPWEQLTGEPARFYDHFRRFLRLGPERSVLRAYRDQRAEFGRPSRTPINAVPQSWREAARAWKWPERAALFDAHQRQIDDGRWDERRSQTQERAWELGQTLAGKAEAMLKFPLARTTTENGQTIIEPVRWTMADAARIAQTADALARLACDLATVRVVHEVDEMTEKELNDEAASYIVALCREGRLSPEIESQLKIALDNESAPKFAE